MGREHAAPGPKGPGAGTESEDAGASPRTPDVHAEAGLPPIPSPTFADTSHAAGALGTGLEVLFTTSERALQWAWRVLQLARGVVDAGPRGDAFIRESRACVVDFLDHIPPHVRRGVEEVLVFCNLWQAVGARLRRRGSFAASDDHAWRQLSEDVELLQRAAQARLGTAAALEQGLLKDLGRLRALALSSGATANEVTVGMEVFTRCIAELMAVASAVRRAWEAAAGELAESAAWLRAGDPAFSEWLAEHLVDSEPAWERTQKIARWLRDVGAFAGQP
ncbi:hypothetical protein [Corallococcus sp. Z5C101001]|uniref:hypothetical protein n=1 Tax=Corallococcus sp. Z5C101001 TaxID=2596829 RepID=UPI001180FEC0|nr:hypothetical protein [Corallococcus sp. Z5C101001]TSC32689.1 hypothetical protein FOF48_06700 [Corallococcus sp. Z5C101001]